MLIYSRCTCDIKLTYGCSKCKTSDPLGDLRIVLKPTFKNLEELVEMVRVQQPFCITTKRMCNGFCSEFGSGLITATQNSKYSKSLPKNFTLIRRGGAGREEGKNNLSSERI